MRGVTLPYILERPYYHSSSATVLLITNYLSPSMPFQAPDGTWWSDDKRYYRSGDQWLLYPGTSSGSTSTQQPIIQQPIIQQSSSFGNQLSTANPSNLAAALNAFPKSSTEPYRQQQQLVFGTNRQTPGRPPAPVFTVDPSFRAAASKDRMIEGFVKSIDNMGRGNV